MIALSLMFLAGYGGTVSLVQMTVAACAGYMYAIFGHSAFMEISLGWPWWATIPVALLIAVAFGTISGALAVRTEGIYTIMITLAIASAFFYFTRQNYIIFNGFSGFNAVKPPPLFGVDWKQATPFYYLSLFFATASYLVVLYVSRSSFGLALQGVRDNARRMEALGFNVTAHRIAAYSFAAVIAGIAGILLTWLNGQVSPGTAGVGPVIDILIIAVVGGLRHPIGPFIGALIYVVLRTFALDALVAVGLPARAVPAPYRNWASSSSCSSRRTGCSDSGRAGVRGCGYEGANSRDGRPHRTARRLHAPRTFRAGIGPRRRIRLRHRRNEC